MIITAPENVGATVRLPRRASIASLKRIDAAMTVQVLTMGTSFSLCLICLLPCAGSAPAAARKRVSFVMTSACVDDPAGEEAGKLVTICFHCYWEVVIDIRCILEVTSEGYMLWGVRWSLIVDTRQFSLNHVRALPL